MISGNIVDVFNSVVYPGEIEVADGRIKRIVKNSNHYDNFIIPGFIDSHVHVESSMLVPTEFARIAAVHGTVATVSDPHEIANVVGAPGIDYLIDDSSKTPFKFYFSVPSCVPFEKGGGILSVSDVERLMGYDNVKCLGEVMDFVGVIREDELIMNKIAVAKKNGRTIDGHAPELSGDALKKYVSHGISTDHECIKLSEALEKIELGMKIQIREGSAAKNFDELAPLLSSHPEVCMFCSDDLHPNDLISGHIDALVRRAVKRGIDPMNALRAACVNPVLHYGLDVGLLREGDPADFVVVGDLSEFGVLKTYIGGILVAENGRPLLQRITPGTINKFDVSPKKPEDFAVVATGDRMRVIGAIDGQLITEKLEMKPKIVNGMAVSDPAADMLKVVVVNRYRESRPCVGFIKNFGLKNGAIASSVTHDSHNIIAVGVSDADICRAVNLVISERGGIVAAGDGFEKILSLPVGGILSTGSYDKVAGEYMAIDAAAKSLGSCLGAPFMTLSFMALIVIPRLKISAAGLFDGEKFEFTSLFI